MSPDDAPGDDARRYAAPFVGVVLAAGAGRRMGVPKALLRDAHGVSLLERAVAALRDGGCEHVVVVLGAQASDVNLAPSDDVSVVVADDWATGMGASMRAGLDACERVEFGPAVAVITLVDVPDVDARVVARVLRASAADGSDALARATFDARPGHPVVIGSTYWAAARAVATGDRGARDLLATRRHRLVECGDLASGADVDTPADLRRLDAMPPAAGEDQRHA